MKVKTAALTQFKALDGEPEGTFEAIVSVFGNVDLAGDRVVQGAFAKSLTTWAASGDPIPVIWSHQWQDPEMHIGGVVEAEERAEGLWVKAQLDVAEDPVAAKVWRLLAGRRVREFSFAYDVREEKQQNGANELLELDVIEVGPTLKGMNPETLLLGAKNRRAARAARATKTGADTSAAETTAAGGTDLEDPDVTDTTTATDPAGDSNGDSDSDSNGEPAPAELDNAADGPARNGPAAGDPDVDDTTKAAAGGRRDRKAMVTLDGSYEQLQDRLRAAALEWAVAAFPGEDIYTAGLEATYADHVVVYVETWSQPWGGGDYFSAPYDVDPDGVASLGDPAPLQVIGIAVPKALLQQQGTAKKRTDTAPAQRYSTPASVLAELDLVELGG